MTASETRNLKELQGGTGHELSWLIFDGLGVRNPYETGATSVFSFLLNMNALFERFVGVAIEFLAGSLPITIRGADGQPRALIHSVGLSIPSTLDELKAGKAGPALSSLGAVIESVLGCRTDVR